MRRGAALQYYPAVHDHRFRHVYDVDTGLIATIIPAAPMAAGKSGPATMTSE